MIIPLVLSKETSSTRDAQLEEGYKKSGGKFATYTGYYPILRGISYYFCAFHTNYLFFSYSYLGFGHTISMVYAIRAGELEIAMENFNLFLYVYLHGLGVSLAIFGRKNLDDIFKGLGKSLYHYSRPITKQEEDIFDDKKTNILLNMNFFCLKGASIFYFGICPIIKTILSGKLSTENDVSPGNYPFNKNLPLKLALPYKTDQPIPYAITFILELLSSHAISITVVGYQNLFVGINVQLWNQLRLLRVSLDELHDRALYLFTSRGFTDPSNEWRHFQTCLMDCLIENIKHHSEILKLHNKVEKFYNPFLLPNFLVNGILVFLAVYQLSQVRIDDEGWMFTTIAILIFLVGSVVQAVLYCQCGQRTTSLSEDLQFAFYNCRWDECTADFRKTLSIAIACAQRNLVFSGYGLVPANITTLVNILKSSYTYMNFMQVAME